jgi:hypothetical protein
MGTAAGRAVVGRLMHARGAVAAVVAVAAVGEHMARAAADLY